MTGAAEARIDGPTLALSGVLDVDAVIALQPVGRQWLQDSRDDAAYRLDLSGVSYSSSAGIALLLDWLRAAAAAGKTLAIDNMPADLAAIARVSGLETVFPSA